MAKFFPINTPLINYFFYPAALPGSNVIAPIAGGKLFFFDDDDHSVELPTYSDVSDPNNPVVNTDPIVLGDAGQTPLFYLENRYYFIVLTDPDGDIDDPIETFSHYNPARLQGLVESFENYVPNGQFWYRNRSGILLEGDEVNIAPGGWYFKRSNGSSSVDTIYFEEFEDYESNPSGNPKYYARLQCTMPDSGDDYKCIAQRFLNVNSFASSDSQQYTDGIALASNDGNSLTVQVYLVKNFGSGGSAQTETLLATYTVTDEFQFFTQPFTFGDNTSTVIGDGSYVDIEFRVPVHSAIDVKLTNHALAFGDVDLNFYPPTPSYTTGARTLSGTLPNDDDDDGMNLLLPVIRTKNGLGYDTSQIGTIIGDTRNRNASQLESDGYFLTDGTGRQVDEYATTGVPFRRLFNYIGYRYGTGRAFVTCYEAATASLLFCLNQNLSPVPTGPADVDASLVSIAGVYTQTDNPQLLTGIAKFSSPYEIVTINKYMGNASVTLTPSSSTATIDIAYRYGLGLYKPLDSTKGNPVRTCYGLSGFASSPVAASYVRFGTFIPAYTLWYIWYPVDGAGSDPAPGGTGLRVDLNSTDSPLTRTLKTVTALNGFPCYEITFADAATTGAGKYWTFTAGTQNYYVWYTLDEEGEDPSVGGAIGIPVSLTTGQTAADVRTETLTAINEFQFATPDYRGVFLQGADDSGIFDYNQDTERFHLEYQQSDKLGSIRVPMIQSHYHDYTLYTDTVIAPYTHPTPTHNSVEFFAATYGAGANDTVPWNKTINWIIKY